MNTVFVASFLDRNEIKSITPSPQKLLMETYEEVLAAASTGLLYVTPNDRHSIQVWVEIVKSSNAVFLCS